MTKRHNQWILVLVTVLAYIAIGAVYFMRRDWLAGLTRHPAGLLAVSIAGPLLPGLASLYLWAKAATLWPQLLWGTLVTVSFWLLLSLIALFLIFGPTWPLIV